MFIEPPADSSAGYAERLSPGHDRGKLNLAPDLDSPLVVQRKTAHLADLIKKSEYVVLHTGAGLSTAAGVSDFRGPKGIWTNDVRKRVTKKEAKPPPKRTKYSEPDSGNDESSASDDYEMCEEREIHEQWDEPPVVHGVDLENAVPTLAHVVIAEMIRLNFVQAIITQNVDCLHLRSGVPRTKLAEIHGNLMMEWCPKCRIEYERDFEIRSAGFQPTGRTCPRCYEPLTDKQLDWENALPEEDEAKAENARVKGDLHIVIGSSNQMIPAREYPFRKGKKHQSVIVNLSPTPKDDSAGMVIRARCDMVLALLANHLGLDVPDWEHSTELTFKAWSTERGRVNAGLHSSLGDDLLCDGKIPFVNSAQLKIDSTDVTGVRKMSETKWILDVGTVQVERKVINLSCQVVLNNGATESFAVTHSGQSSSISKQVIARRIRHFDAARREVKLLERKAADPCHWKHLARAPRAWLVSASKPRYSACILCNHVMYSGGGRWLPNAISHLQVCAARNIGSQPEQNTPSIS